MNKKRTRAYTRHQRRRIIQRKLSILKFLWTPEACDQHVIGKLNKGKVHCSCRMCRYEEYYHIPKAKVKAKLQAMKQEMDE